MKIVNNDPVTSPVEGRQGNLRFHIADVTRMHGQEVADFPRGTTAGVVAETMAHRWQFPTNVPWSLRDDRKGEWLNDDQALDEQLDNGTEARLTLTPKTHLG